VSVLTRETTRRVAWFADESVPTEVLGGKGVNLARLARGGFPVPPGFTVTTAAYLGAVDGSAVATRIAELDRVVADPGADAAGVTTAADAVADAVRAMELPAELRAEIEQAYAELGQDCFVAVRSSGTAEDLAGSSFAGLHDTYLDVRGTDAVLDAIRRCWASLWTARAVSYRRDQGFTSTDLAIAVVVQRMVDSETSGVMFTGNPLTAANDEVVIDASWGLGEAVVGGITTPDHFVVRARTARIRERTLGAKETRVDRAPDGQGTVTTDTAEDLRAVWSLTDEQVVELTSLGLRVQQLYDGIPQDIEWALADGRFALLQARPITGVEFAWDDEVTRSLVGNNDDDPVYSRAWANEIWTGAVTPLMFSIRGWCNSNCLSHMYDRSGLEKFDAPTMRHFIFHKGAAYYNAEQDRAVIEYTCPPMFRPGMLFKLPTSWHADTLAAPFDWLHYLKMHVKHQVVAPKEGLTWYRSIERFVTDPANIAEFDGMSVEELRRLPDGALTDYIDKMVVTEGEFYHLLGWGTLFMFRDALNVLGLMLAQWYDGDPVATLTDLVTGTRKTGMTARENRDLWALAEAVRTSPELTEHFRTHPGRRFFDELPDTEAGRAFRDRYAGFIATHGHRGHADRDIYYTRRAEDPGVDYRALQSLLSVRDAASPQQREAEVNARREAVADEVERVIRRTPFGGLKAEAFKWLVEYIHRCLKARDDERYFIDRSTFLHKRAFTEVGRRCVERGMLDGPRDFYFLTKEELYDTLAGRANPVLTRAKVAGRMRDFDRLDAKDAALPHLIQHGRQVNLDLDTGPAIEGRLQGAGTSRGVVTGTARVVKTLDDVGRVAEGDILITHATDPGWTAVFLVIKGLVLETGGLLAHGALLSREYGLPAVQLAGAMTAIPDGATITVDGDAGTVTLEEGS